MDWKVRKLLAQGKITKGEAIRGTKGRRSIHFNDAFHGRSGYTLSVTNTNDPNKYQFFAKYDWPRDQPRSPGPSRTIGRRPVA